MADATILTVFLIVFAVLVILIIAKMTARLNAMEIKLQQAEGAERLRQLAGRAG